MDRARNKETMATVSAVTAALGAVRIGGASSVRGPSSQRLRVGAATRRHRGVEITATTPTMMSLEAGVGLYGKKAGMTMIYSEEGSALPVTVIVLEDGANVVTEKMTEDKHGYSAVQVGYNVTADKHMNKPEAGHLAKNGLSNLRSLAEFRVASDEAQKYEIGQKLVASEMFNEGDLVDVRGKSTGKGFQGTVKRHGFSRGPMAHGSKNHRKPGSIGMSATPARVLPGKKMAGKMGNKMVKARKLKVVKVDDELGVVLVKGSVPGKPGSTVRVTPAKIVGVNV